MPSSLFNISNYYFNPYAIPPLVVGVLIFSIGLFAFLQNKKSLVNLAFWFQCSSVALWVSAISFVYISRDATIALWWYRHFTFLGVVNIMPSFSLLAIAWAGQFRQKRILVFLNYAISFLFYFLAISTANIIDPYQIRRYFWGFYPIYKPWAVVFLVIYTLQCADAFRILYLARRRETIPIKKTQIFMIMIATFVALAASVDFLPKFFYVPLYPFGYLPIFIYVCLVAYSIVRYRIFDIETAIHKTSMWLLSSSFIIVPMLFLYKILRPHIKENMTLELLFWLSCFFMLAFYLRVIQPKIDHFFQRRHSNLREVSDRFTANLIHLKGLGQLIKHIEDAVSDTIYPQDINIYIYNDDAKTYKLANTDQKPHHGPAELTPDDKFLKQLTKNDKIAHKELIDIDPLYAAIKIEAKHYFEKTSATIAIPLVLNDTLLGVINLGKKSNLKRYTGPEFHFLTALKNQATIAIANSLLYENMEEQVRQRTKELVDVQKQLIQAEKLATVGTLAGGVAHEINNPLTAILTNVQMLLTSGTIDDKLDKESLELIEEATKRCRTIVQKLMAYARKPLETSKISQINLLDVSKNVISFIGYQLEQDNIKINMRAGGDAYYVMGNQNELEQVFTNIILNSRDAIKKIKKSSEITIAFFITDDWVKIDIQDKGEGISDAIAAKIFDPFFTTKDVGRGVGLGLSICQAIVEKHKGSISFKSKAGVGTTFTILLPRVKKGVAMHVGNGKTSH